MEKILKVHNVNDYARYIGAPELHQLVSVIHYDELEHCRHSLNNYDVYAMFIADETLEDLSYGQIQYVLNRHALMCVAPGQIGGKTDIGEEIQTKGWALLFDPKLLNGSELGRRMSRYTFFSYNTSEALLMNDEQRSTLVTYLEALRNELTSGINDAHTGHIIVDYISLILEHVARFYAQQLSLSVPTNSHMLTRFENLLKDYYAKGLYQEQGLPTVKYCAQEMFLSPNYFCDLIKEITGDTASSIIRRFIMQRAINLIINGSTITETAELLGFEYPQHFSRMFKKYYGASPKDYMRSKKTEQ